MTFEQLLAKATELAAAAEQQLQNAIDAMPLEGESRWEALGVAHTQAGILATLAETYARLASAVIVNRTSLASVVETVEARQAAAGGAKGRPS